MVRPLLVLFLSFSIAFAEEPGSLLQQKIEAIEAIDQEIQEATRELKATPVPASRRELQSRIRKLQDQQEQQLQELEEFVGPLPPEVRSDPRVLLNEQMELQRRRHETVLESDVDRRFKR